MTLFFTGCSFTYGDDLDDPQSQSWPAIVAKKKNQNFVNNAVSGGTNDRIVYQVVKNIDSYEKFYIAWTSIERFTRYRQDNNFEINFNPLLLNSLYRNNYEFREYGKIHYAYWHNNLYAFKLWLQQIRLVQSLLREKKKPYVMMNTLPNNIKRWSADWKNFNNSVKSLLCFDMMDDDLLYKEHIEIQESLGNIDFDNFINWSEWNIGEFCDSFDKGATGHPLSSGHQKIADYIIAHDTN